MRRAVAASLAPHRTARAAAEAARPAAAQTEPNATKPNAPLRPRRRRAPPSSPLETLLALFAANWHAPDRTTDAPAAAPPAVASLGLPGPLAPERTGATHAAAPRHAPRRAPSLGLSEPLAPVDPRSPTPPHPVIASLLTALAANLHALERAAAAPPTAAAPPAVPTRGRSETRRSKPLAPVAARAPRAEPLAPDPALPAPLNRAARRRARAARPQPPLATGPAGRYGVVG
jgi:DnaK suppressor protein